MKLRTLSFALILALCAAAPTFAPRTAAAVSDSIVALAGPLAEQFGVPASAVTALLEGGLDLETVTQLLLVQQGSDSSLDGVTKRFREEGGDVSKTAEELGVAKDAYSDEKVDATLAGAREKLAASASKEATDQAGEAAGKAMDSLGGFMKK